jgi:hypothetical protein
MAIVMISDAGTDTVEQYDRIIEHLEETGHGRPPGRLWHMAALKDNGSYFVVDLWESPQALDRFARILVPAIRGVGGMPPELRISQLHHLVSGR